MNAITEARYNLGKAYLNESQYNEAIQEFETVIERDAEFIDAHCGLSRAYLELNELAKAETSALAALSLDSDYPAALSLTDTIKNTYYDNGVTYLNEKRNNDAVITFQKVIELDSDFKHVHYNLGRAFIQLKQYDKAINSLQTAIDSDTALEDVHYHLGCAYVEQRQFNKAIQNLEQAIIGNPNHKEAYYNLAHAYRETGNLEAATNAATETLRLDPNYQPIHDLVESIKQTHYNRGIAYLNDERYSDAVAAFQNVITLDSDFTAAHFNLGIAYLKMENFPRAADVLRKTVTLDRTHKAAFHTLALAYFGQHELEKARNAAKDALKIDPNYQPARALLKAIDPSFSDFPAPSIETQDATTQPETDTPKDLPIEKVKQARPSDDKSIPVEPETSPQEKPDVKKDLDRGIIFLNSKQYQQAAAAFKRVIKVNPNCIEAYCGLGESYLEIGAFDDAKSAAEEVLKLDPRHQQAHELLQTIQYIVNLKRKQEIRKRVLSCVSIVVVIAFGMFVAWRFGLIPFLNVSETPDPIPPKLSIDASLEDTSRKGFIYAGEIGQLKLIIRNIGGPSDNFRIQFQPASIQGLRFKNPEDSYKLNKDSSMTDEIKITADKSMGPKTASLQIQLIGKNNELLATKNFTLKIKLRPDPVD
jgi:tetratricopeptide (TPR) repeat protein